MDPEYDNCCPAKMSMTTQAFIEGARKKTGRGTKAKVKAKPKPKPKPKPGEGPTMTAAVNPSSWRRMHRSSEILDGRRR